MSEVTKSKPRTLKLSGEVFERLVASRYARYGDTFDDIVSRMLNELDKFEEVMKNTN